MTQEILSVLYKGNKWQLFTGISGSKRKWGRHIIGKGYIFADTYTHRQIETEVLRLMELNSTTKQFIQEYRG